MAPAASSLPSTADDFLARLTTGAPSSLADLLEMMLGWAQIVFGNDTLIASRERFFQEMGKAFSQDTFYDTRMSYFFDQFLFEQVLRDDATPFAILKTEIAAKNLLLPGAVAEKFESFTHARHSFFEIAKVEDKLLHLKDLIVPQKFVVSADANQLFKGFEKRSILQCFVYQHAHLSQLGSGQICHPPRVAPLLKKQLKSARKSASFSLRSELCRWATVNMRHLRHKHVDPRVIYAG